MILDLIPGLGVEPSLVDVVSVSVEGYDDETHEGDEVGGVCRCSIGYGSEEESKEG